MAKKPSSKAPEIPGRNFTDKALTEKAQRWAVQMKRAGNGGRLATDTIPGTYLEVRSLAQKLFTTWDASVFLTALDQAVQ